MDLAERISDILYRSGKSDEGHAILSESVRLSSNAIENMPVWEAPAIRSEDVSDHLRSLYLGLMEKIVSNWIYEDSDIVLSKARPRRFEDSRRSDGRGIPETGHTMIGLKRLRHLRWAAETALTDNITGDFLEAGVWRGGAVILMRAVLEAYADRERQVWAADSFEGLPPPDPRYFQDMETNFAFHDRPELSVDVDAVKHNISRYGFAHGQIKFVKGYFRDTLPSLRNLRLAILRVDGDWYSSTMDVLENLYGCVSDGGFIILDDYGAVVDSQRAVLDFREKYGIYDPMYAVDGDAVFWRKKR